MTTDGSFTPGARQIIYEAGDHRCIGCGRTNITTQHRRARGMGGTSNEDISHPANGLPLCGDGVRGCHGWAEANPTAAALLGWRLAPGQPALSTPFWSRLWGWRAWVMVDGLPHTQLLDPDQDLDRLPERLAALDLLHRTRLAKPRKATA